MTGKRKNPNGRHGKPKGRPSPAPERSGSRDAGRRRDGRPEFSRAGSNDKRHGGDRPRNAPLGRREPPRGNEPPRRNEPLRRNERPHHGDRPHGEGSRSERPRHGEGPRSERSRHPTIESPRREAERRAREMPKSEWPRSAFDEPPKAVPIAPRELSDEAPEQPLLDRDPELDEDDFAAAQLAGDDYDYADDDQDDDFMEEAPELGIGARVVPPNLRYEGESSPSTPPPSSPLPPRDVEAQIRALEARLDGLIRRAALSEESDGEKPEESHALSVAPPPVVATTTDSATRDYVARRWGREALRHRSEEVDDFGLDPSLQRKVEPGLELLYRRYFRVQIEGMEHVPRAGRAVIVANHSGALPLDGMMLRTAMRLDHPGVRDLRWLAEDFLFYLPFAGVFLNRIGAVRACPENAERLLSHDALVAVFPEGVQGIRKLFRERYQLQRFGRGGYIRLCLRMRAPLIPCAIIGGEETNPLLYRFDRLAELLKLPYLPVTPTFPWLGPLGLIPAPARWKIRFGEPLSFDSYGPEAADDDVLVGRLSERVRGSIQGLLDTGLRERKSVWFG